MPNKFSPCASRLNDDERSAIGAQLGVILKILQGRAPNAIEESLLKVGDYVMTDGDLPGFNRRRNTLRRVLINMAEGSVL